MTTHASLRRDLRKAARCEDSEALIRHCREAVAYWNKTYWPDDWADWERALWDNVPNVSLDDLQ